MWDSSFTGILGFRTIHQVDAKSQMVLIPKTTKPSADEVQSTELSGAQSDDVALRKTRSSVPGESDEFCDILRTPLLAQNVNVSNNESTQIPLTPVQQAAVLAQCLHVSRKNRSDEMSGWEMAPYIESIDSQDDLCFVVRSLCDVLRIRWESTRSRTKQRALLLMENLVEDISKGFPVTLERARLVFGVHMPTLPALRKEYGELLISCGLLGEALNIFKDLELWDNLIYCYRLSGKLADAVSLINTRLSITSNDPSLWSILEIILDLIGCSLGDATNNANHYKKALEVSNNKSARALDKDLEKAVDAFTRAVQIDPENGEAWNNIACLHMIRGKNQASVQAFRETVKFKRTSWEVWENYSKVALDTGNIGLTLEAINMVLNLSFKKHFNVDLLNKVMTTLEEQATHLNATQDAKSIGNTSEDSNKETRQSSQLLDIIGDILEQIVQSGDSNPDIWGLYARCHKSKGNLMKCSKTLRTQVQYLQGSELCHDYKKFTKFAQASLQLCKVYMEISSTTGSKWELLSAEMHLKSSLKQQQHGKGGEDRVDKDLDGFSALPDDVLLAILQLVDLRTAVRVGALARRLRRLPRLLTDLVIDVADMIPHSWDFSPHTADHVMSAYTDATRWFPAATKERSIKSLRLSFHLIDPYLRSIGDAVVESGGAERLEFAIQAHLHPTNRVRHAHHAKFARCLMAFLAACPVAFGWFTSLTLQNISFSDSNMLDLLNACNRLQLLSLIRCGGSDFGGSILRIEAPSSSLRALEIRDSLYPGLELTSLPKLERVFCDDGFDFIVGIFPVRFGNVPLLHDVNLSAQHLYYCYDNPGQIFPAFSNLGVIHLCDLDIQKMVWTVCVLEGAPLLETLSLKIHGPPCYEANVVEEAPDFEHRNLSLLEMKGSAGFREDFEVARYMSLVVERAVSLKKIRFVEQCPFVTSCLGVRCSHCRVDEQRTNLLSKVLADAGFVRSVVDSGCKKLHRQGSLLTTGNASVYFSQLAMQLCSTS